MPKYIGKFRLINTEEIEFEAKDDEDARNIVWGLEPAFEGEGILEAEAERCDD